MRLLRLLPKRYRTAAMVVAMLLGALGFQDQLPAVARDLLPSFVDVLRLPGAFTGDSTSRAKEVAPKSTGTYWPGLPISRNEKLVPLTHIGYAAGYSTRVYSPLWTAYAIKAVKNPQSPKRPDSFTPNPALPAQHQVANSEYTRSGFDRGHLAPNWAVSISYGREAQIETFYTSNITPQKPELNQGIWQALESIEANDYARRYDGVVSFAGPIYDPASKAGIGNGKRIRIPSAFYKIIVRRYKGEVGVLAFIIPQTARGNGQSLPQFLVSVDAIEKATGLDFLTALPEKQQATLEATAAKRMW